MPELDKYAPYVLACYGIAVFVIVAMVIWTVQRLGAARKRLEALEAETAAPTQAATSTEGAGR